MPSGPARDLAKLRRRQATVLLAIKFAGRREGDVIDVEVDPHANSIGRYEIAHVARLVESNLSVARSWRQRTKHDGRAAMLPADELGDGVNLRR